MIAGAFGESGFPSRAFDILRSETHDLTLPTGVVLGMISVLGLPIGCALHLGTVCTSFCWLNSGTHQRSPAFPLGCMDYSYVVNGNAFATVSAPCQCLDLCHGYQVEMHTCHFITDLHVMCLLDKKHAQTYLFENPLLETEAAFLWVAWLRGCVPTLEQPRGSKLIVHPALQALVSFLIDICKLRVFGNLHVQ